MDNVLLCVKKNQVNLLASVAKPAFIFNPAAHERFIKLLPMKLAILTVISAILLWGDYGDKYVYRMLFLKKIDFVQF